jgi:hypothetical protein
LSRFCYEFGPNMSLAFFISRMNREHSGLLPHERPLTPISWLRRGCTTFYLWPCSWSPGRSDTSATRSLLRGKNSYPVSEPNSFAAIFQSQYNTTQGDTGTGIIDKAPMQMVIFCASYQSRTCCGKGRGCGYSCLTPSRDMSGRELASDADNHYQLFRTLGTDGLRRLSP